MIPPYEQSSGAAASSNTSVPPQRPNISTALNLAVKPSDLKRKEEEPTNLFSNKKVNLDPLAELTILLQRMKVFDSPNLHDKFAELVGNIAQKPVEKEDIPRVSGILHVGNLALFKTLPLEESTKTALLSLVAQIVKFGIQKPSFDSLKTLYHNLLPVMQWLFETQKTQLSQTDEESLAKALMLSARYYYPLSEADLQWALPLIHAVRCVLPASLNRLAAFPLSKEIIIPVFGLLALNDLPNQPKETIISVLFPAKFKVLSERWQKLVPSLPMDADHSLMKKLDTVRDPETCQTLISALTQIRQKIGFFPELSEQLWEKVETLFQIGMPVAERDPASYFRLLDGFKFFVKGFSRVENGAKKFAGMMKKALAYGHSAEPGPLIRFLRESQKRNDQCVLRNLSPSCWKDLLQNWSQRRLSLQELVDVF